MAFAGLWVAALFILASYFTGCSTSSIRVPAEHRDVAPSWIRTELFFGLVKRDAGVVSEAEWMQFVQEFVVPRFPAGFTITAGDGRWRDASGLAHSEPSKVIIVLFPKEDLAPASRKLEELAAGYIRRFDQESVLRDDAEVNAQFYATSADRPFLRTMRAPVLRVR